MARIFVRQGDGICSRPAHGTTANMASDDVWFAIRLCLTRRLAAGKLLDAEKQPHPLHSSLSSRPTRELARLWLKIYTYHSQQRAMASLHGMCSNIGNQTGNISLASLSDIAICKEGEYPTFIFLQFIHYRNIYVGIFLGKKFIYGFSQNLLYYFLIIYCLPSIIRFLKIKVRNPDSFNLPIEYKIHIVKY